MRLALSLSVAMGDQGHASSLDIVYIVLQLYLPMEGQNNEVSSVSVCCHGRPRPRLLTGY